MISGLRGTSLRPCNRGRGGIIEAGREKRVHRRVNSVEIGKVGAISRPWRWQRKKPSRTSYFSRAEEPARSLASNQRECNEPARARFLGIFSFNLTLNKFQFAGASNFRVAVVDIQWTGRRVIDARCSFRPFGRRKIERGRSNDDDNKNIFNGAASN